MHLVDRFSAWCPRLTAAMILFGSLVQIKGFGFALVLVSDDGAVEHVEGGEQRGGTAGAAHAPEPKVRPRILRAKSAPTDPPGHAGGGPCVRAPKPRRRPPRARHRAVNSTPTRHPCPAADGAAAHSQRNQFSSGSRSNIGNASSPAMKSELGSSSQ